MSPTRPSLFRRIRRSVLAWRDRRLSDPGFQRRSLHLFLTRPIARRRIRALFDLCSGFVYSQVLLACVRLKLFERLAEGPVHSADLARALDIPQAPMQRLLEAAVSLELVEDRGVDGYGLGPLGAALLGNPAVAMMIEHHAMFYRDLDDPVALMRGEAGPTRLNRYWAYASGDASAGVDAGRVAAYTELMAASQAMIADQVLAAWSMRGRRRLLDLGGGSGAFAAAALHRWPGLEATVFDLPAVAEQARQRFRDQGLSARASVIGGSFFDDALPSGFDLVSLVRIAHDHDDDRVQALLERIRAAIAPGGTVLIAEPMLETPGAEPIGAAYFGFYLMAMGQGRARSPSTLEAMLRTAGFSQVRLHATAAPLLVRVMTAVAEENR